MPIGRPGNYYRLSENCLVLRWSEAKSRELTVTISQWANYIEQFEGVQECTPTYRELAIHFDFQLTSHRSLETLISDIKPQAIQEIETQLWEIPVCYDPEFGLDLERVMESTGLGHQNVIQIHTLPTYFVYMLGFQPGFIYMGEVDKQLQLPRLAKPRLRVPEGSIAIANDQAGIYSVESPGGWQIIGRTPMAIFDIKKSKPNPVRPGDELKFKPISKDEFLELEKSNLILSND